MLYAFGESCRLSGPQVWKILNKGTKNSDNISLNKNMMYNCHNILQGTFQYDVLINLLIGIFIVTTTSRSRAGSRDLTFYAGYFMSRDPCSPFSCQADHGWPESPWLPICSHFKIINNIVRLFFLNFILCTNLQTCVVGLVCWCGGLEPCQESTS